MNPFQSPAIVLAMSSIVALVWAFQQQGWAYCIPCTVFIAKKITRVRRQDIVAVAARIFGYRAVRVPLGVRSCVARME